jgi:hypothetical protein
MRFLLAATAALALSACAAGNEPLTSSTKTVSPQTTAKLTAIAKMATVANAASHQAYSVAQAGQNLDAASAQVFAATLAEQAASIQEQAQEVANNGGCGSDTGSVTQDDVDNAVNEATAASEAANEVSDSLNPPTQQQCSQVCGCEGCSQQCSEQPGNVDQSQLQQGINDANNAGAGLNNAGQNLGQAPAPSSSGPLLG